MSFGLLGIAVPALLVIQRRLPWWIRRFVDQPVKALGLGCDCSVRNARIGRPRSPSGLRFLHPVAGLILGDLLRRLAGVSLLILTGNLPIGLLESLLRRPDNARFV